MNRLLAITIITCLAASSGYASDLSVDDLVVGNDATVHGDLVVGGPGAVPTEGMKLYYSFDSDTVPVPDDSGNNNTGAVVNATWISGGVSGGAYHFDGTNYVKAHYTESLDVFADSNWTFSAWVKLDYESGDVWTIFNAIWHRPWFQTYSGRMRLSYTDINEDFAHRVYTYPSGLISTNWCHVAVVSDGVKYRLYIDAIERNNDDYAPISQTDPGCYLIGATLNAGSGLRGAVDEVRIYDRALINAEITSLFYAGKSQWDDGGNVDAGKVNLRYPAGDVSMGSFTNKP